MSRWRLMTVCSAASLLLCVAACSFWVRSYWRADAWSWGTRTGRAGIESAQGPTPDTCPECGTSAAADRGAPA